LDEPSTPYDPVAGAIANPDWFDHTSDFFAGFADNASFGLTYAGRSGMNYLTGSQNLTNYNGAAYSAGGWAATALEVPGIGSALKAAGKGISKRVGAVYAQQMAKRMGDDVAGLAARQAAGDCSFWKRVIKGTMCFAAGTKVHLSSLPDASATATPFELSVDGPLQPSAVKAKTDQSLLVPIEDVPLGATVDAQNPDGTGFDAVRGVASDWQRIELVMHRSDGAILEAELLRHRSETKLLEVGQWYELATDEEELSGWAQIVAIDDNVQLGDGEGNLVVSRFKTIANKEVVRVTLENGEDIVGTPGHRIWSLTEKSFKSLGASVANDQFDTTEDSASVSEVRTVDLVQNVFNLEVAGQHVFRISDSGVLVHNTGSGNCDDIAENASKWTSKDPLVADIANQIDELYPGLVQKVNEPLFDAAGKLVTDADILLKNAILQIKSGGGKKLANQVLRTESVTDLPVIAFGPTLKGSVVKQLQKQGSLVTRSLKDLLEIIAP
jgi:hypothetical protein